MGKANRELQDKQTYLKKKAYHLKTSNLGEQEYRMKEKALQNAEVEEINEIKEELFKKLASLKLPGFQTKEDLIQQRVAALGSQFEPLKHYELEERSYLGYQKQQMSLLEILLKADYSSNAENKPPQRGEGNHDSQANMKKGPYIPNLTRREKKPIIIKLSKYLRDDLANFSREDRQPADNSFVEGLKPTDFHKVSTTEVLKLNETRSDKTYYDEAEIDAKYETTKNFLTHLRTSNDFVVENLDNEKVGQLIDAVSFSLNGVHYYQKLKKTKSMIHPIDILYILSKFK